MLRTRRYDGALLQKGEAYDVSEQRGLHLIGRRLAVEHEGDAKEPVKEAPKAPEPEEIPAFEDLKVSELKDYAKDHDIDLAGAKKKKDIIKAIEDAL